MDRLAAPDRRVNVTTMLIGWLAGLAQDLRLTLRRLAQARGFTTVAVLTLALGIGANTAIYTVVHHLLIAPEPYPDGNSLVMLMRTAGGGSFPFPADTADFSAWRNRAHLVEDLNASVASSYLVAEAGSSDSVSGARVTPGYVRMLRIQPVMGRAFMASDTNAGAAPVAMISRGLWRTGYGGRRDILGRLVHVNGRPFTIVGVIPGNLTTPVELDTPLDVLVPLRLDSTDSTDFSFEAFARLRPSVTEAAASRELTEILRSDPATGDSHMGSRAMRSQDFVHTREADTVKVLFAAVGVLLLLACANVANLLLVRGATRHREFALRRALGAGPGRLIRQVLAESVVVALLGGALGILVAQVGLHVILALGSRMFWGLDSTQVDRAVLIWSCGISVASGIGFGSIPALIAARRSPGDLLRGGGRWVSGGATTGRLRAILVVGEVALALVLLGGAGLLTHSFIDLVRTPLGFDANGLLSPVAVPKQGADPKAANAEANAAAARLRGIPGVVGVQRGSFPAWGFTYVGDFETETSAGPKSTDVHAASATLAEPGYFNFLRIPLLAGRGFDSTDAGAVGQRVVINRALANRLWPGRNPLGLRLRPGVSSAWMTVIGVANDVDLPGQVGDAHQLQLYLEPNQEQAAGQILIRARDPLAAANGVRQVMESTAPLMRFIRIDYPKQPLDVGLAPQRFAMSLMGVFALVALLLTAVGLYGVIAYAVSNRTREIGIRVALGANPRAVSRLVVGEGLKLTAIGLVIGLMGAALATRALKSMLFGLNPLDPVTFVGIAALLVGTTLIAAYVPARRALRIDPTEALRAE